MSDTEYNVNCPHCGGELVARDEWAGAEAPCPLCRNIFVIPRRGGMVSPLRLQPSVGKKKISPGKMLLIVIAVIGWIILITVFITSFQKTQRHSRSVSDRAGAGRNPDDVLVERYLRSNGMSAGNLDYDRIAADGMAGKIADYLERH